MKQKTAIHKYFKWILLSLFIGVLAGSAAFIFLFSLEFANQLFKNHHQLLYLLPFAGFIIVWTFQKLGNGSEKGTHLIIEEIHDPKRILPARMAPFVVISTILTHVTGGSAGREGTAVQMAASLSDQLAHFFKLHSEERKTLLIAGAGAGFSAAIGAPFAGIIFGMEMIYIGRFKPVAILECSIASFVAFYTAVFLGAKHTHFATLQEFSIDPHLVYSILIAALSFGLAARFFILSTHQVEKILNQKIKSKSLQAFIVGFLLVILFQVEGSFRFNGLSLDLIINAFQTPSSLEVPFFKSIFTSLTIGSGFKGGEFIPLVLIGASLGSFIAGFMNVSIPLLAGLGFVSTFGAAAKTPITCTIMAMELFGYQIGPWALISCMISYFIAGKKGIYKNQLDLHS